MVFPSGSRMGGVLVREEGCFNFQHVALLNSFSFVYNKHVYL